MPSYVINTKPFIQIYDVIMLEGGRREWRGSWGSLEGEGGSGGGSWGSLEGEGGEGRREWRWELGELEEFGEGVCKYFLFSLHSVFITTPKFTIIGPKLTSGRTNFYCHFLLAALSHVMSISLPHWPISRILETDWWVGNSNNNWFEVLYVFCRGSSINLRECRLCVFLVCVMVVKRLI